MEENVEKPRGLFVFLSLADRSGNLSLTHAAVATLLCRVLVAPGWPAVTALGIALAGYAHKRFENAKAEARATQVSEARSLAQKVDELAKLQDGVAAQAAETKKQQEEIKKTLSSAVLVNAFKPPVRRGQVNAG